MTTIDKNLLRQRRELAETLADCVGGFPGSAEYKAESVAMAALAAFDEAHPEVIAYINANRSARIASEHPYQD